MSSILGCAFILLANKVLVSASENVSEKFKEFGVVPDVICVAPSTLAEVVYPNGARVLLGNKLEANEILTSPSVDWEADPSSFYTLAMVDPDAPSRNLPLLREFLHWLIGNIPGSDVANGETISFYAPPIPSPGSGLHRYVFLMYEQPERIEFDRSLLNFTTTQLRASFSIRNFAKKYELGNPSFGCFCQVQILPLQLI